MVSSALSSIGLEVWLSFEWPLVALGGFCGLVWEVMGYSFRLVLRAHW